MLRTVIFLLQLAILAAAAVWIADRPGQVTIRWLGREITTEVGVLLLAVFLLMLLAALGYHLWRRLLGAPGETLRAMGQSRRRRGLQALSNGLIAVAAGEVEEARRWSRKAEQLLDEPALTQLLAAQVAEIDGDHERAHQLFDAMLARPETRFLGLRGLVQQALAQGDTQAALRYVEEAHRLRPDTPWVLDTLFDLAERDGRLAEAGRVLAEARRRGVLPAAEADRRKAVVLLEDSLQQEQQGETPAAFDRAKQALRLSPELTAAAQAAARLAARLGKTREGERILERAWTLQPHPALAELYLGLTRPGNALARLRLLRRLTGGQPEHPETLLVLAGAAIEAERWSEARSILAPLEQAPADQRVARLFALLAEVEEKDPAAAQAWRERAAALPAAPTWHCKACGQAQTLWQPRCARCGGFDSLVWSAGPPGEIALGTLGEAPAELEETAPPTPAVTEVPPLPAEAPAAPPPPAPAPPPPRPAESAPGPAEVLSPEDAARRGL